MPATKMIWSQASRITAVSEFTKELALRAYRVPVKVIPNGLDLSRCSVESYEVHDPVRLLFVGRLNAQKNLPFFLRVLNRVKDLRWHFDILGDGPQRQEIESGVATLGLAGRVKMRGWVEPSVVDELMRESDVLALPSTSEGMPIAALRALGFALAVLGSRIGGLKDLVQEGENGFLCSVNDEAGFETRLRELVGTPDRLAAMKKRSRNLAQRFCMEAITSEYEETFREVLR